MKSPYQKRLEHEAKRKGKKPNSTEIREAKIYEFQKELMQTNVLLNAINHAGSMFYIGNLLRTKNGVSRIIAITTKNFVQNMYSRRDWSDVVIHLENGEKTNVNDSYKISYYYEIKNYLPDLGISLRDYNFFEGKNEWYGQIVKGKWFDYHSFATRPPFILENVN